MENALAQSQNVQQFAQNPQNFGGGYAGGFGAIAQGLTAGIGAYAQYKQRQQIAQIEADDIAKFSEFATNKGDSDLASIASQLTPETRQAYYMAKTMPETMGYGFQAPASQREYEYFKNLTPEQQAQYLNLKRNIAGEGGIVRETGNIDTLRGYGQAGAQRTGMEQTAKNVSDLNYKPAIASDGSIAIRICKANFAQKLMQAFGKPIVSTSANISGLPTPKCFSDTSLDIIEGVDYVVRSEQEDTTLKEPSAIVKWENDQIIIIRS